MPKNKKGGITLNQVEKVIEQCKMALLAKVPVLYILTDDYKLVNDVVHSNKLVELLYMVTDEKGEKNLYSQREMVRSGYSDIIKEAKPANVTVDTFTTPSILGNVSGYSGDKNPAVIHVVYNYDHGLEKISSGNDKTLVSFVEKYVNSEDNDPGNIRKTVVILVGPTVKIPAGLENYVQIIEVPPLEDTEIKETIEAFTAKEKENNYSMTKSYLDEMVTRFKGLSKYKIIEILRKIKQKNGCICNINDEKDKKIIKTKTEIAFSFIKQEKEQTIKKAGVLSYIDVKKDSVEVGGLENLKEWLDDQNTILENYEEAKKCRVDFAKGLLITGVPGCGKSLMAKYTASKFNVPLVQMDMGALQSSLLGESEANMRRALKTVEAMAPCVLWIDEVEKGLSGSRGDGSTDGGTSQRMLATLLTWLQENKELIFSFITANDISKLPPELLRLGRISKKYSVAIPTYKECVEIFLAQISRKAKDKNGKKNEFLFDDSVCHKEYWKDILEYCAEKGKFLTGGDIEVIINAAMTKYYLKYKEVAGCYEAEKFKTHLKATIDETTPFGQTNMKDIVCYQILQEENQFEYAAKSRIINKNLKEDFESENASKPDNIYDSKLKEAIFAKYKEIIEEKK